MTSHISQVAIEGWSSDVKGSAGAAPGGLVGKSCIIDGSYIGMRTDSCMYGMTFSAALIARAYEATWARFRGEGRMAVWTPR